MAEGKEEDGQEEGEECLPQVSSSVHTNTMVWEARHNEAQTTSDLLCNLSHNPSTGQPGVEGP